MDTKAIIENGEAILGIEFGSTRIKAVLIDNNTKPIAMGGYDWENTLSGGLWTYALEDVRKGMQSSFKNLAADVATRYGTRITRLKAIGISAMMHGYLVFDKDGKQLASFRTWRNTNTGEAADRLSALFAYPVPERWSISHLFQAILNEEESVKDIAFMTTLSGYVHYLLTGKKVLGIGDASGMFPIDSDTNNFDAGMIDKFSYLVKDRGFSWSIKSILPKVLVAGEDAGILTKGGALLLDPSGTLAEGCPLCPPEGDAGTGMVATNSVRKKKGNVSAGTSVFAMVVLEHTLRHSYPKFIDLVTTPDGSPVAMAHANNCTGEYDKWMHLFSEVLDTMGIKTKKGELYDKLLSTALEGDKDCGGLLPYNYISGETMTGIYEGRPLFVRAQDASFTLANFMRAQLFTALAALRTGMDILFENEGVKIDSLTGHGGYFKTAKVGQTIMATVMHTPLTVMSTAGEGGAWGIALLASYLVKGKGIPLADYLDEIVFAGAESSTIIPKEEDIKGFDRFFATYKRGLPLEKAASEFI